MSKKQSKSELGRREVKLSINEKALNDFGISLEKGINSILDKYNDEDITHEMINSISSCASQIAAEIGMSKKDFMKIISDYFDETINEMKNSTKPAGSQLN